MRRDRGSNVGAEGGRGVAQEDWGVSDNSRRVQDWCWQWGVEIWGRQRGVSEHWSGKGQWGRGECGRNQSALGTSDGGQDGQSNED